MSLLHLARHIVEKERYPALVFFFSRKRVEEEAHLLSQQAIFLGKEDAEYVRNYLTARVPEEIRFLHRSLWQCLTRGVGYHHAGLAPTAKQMVEELFEQGYLPFVFCTETFALGVNFPARTVILGSSSKRDDEGYRQLSNRELLQITGRAGRRGTDDQGYAYLLVDTRFPEEVPLTPPEEPEPVQSRFAVTPQLVLRLAPTYAGRRDVLENLLRKSFRAFQLSWAVERRRHLQEELREVHKTMAQLAHEHTCTAIQQACPHWRRPRQLELESLQEKLADLESSPKRGRKQERQLQDLRQRLKNLRVALARKVTPCRYGEAVEGGQGCPVFSTWRGLVRRSRRLKGSLQHLPDPTGELVQSFRKMELLLQKYGFLAEDSQLTAKGDFARRIGPGGILLGEALLAGGLETLQPEELAALAGGVLLEDDPEPEFSGSLPLWAKWAYSLSQSYRQAGLPTGFDRSAVRPLLAWAGTGSLDQVWQKTATPPGDLVMLARRAAEALKEALANLTLLGREDLEPLFRQAHLLIWQGEVSRL